MKVKCIHRRGSALPEELLRLGNTPDTVFHVTYGNSYIVYAINLWKGSINYLILEDGEQHKPDWYPANLFEVTDSRMPSTWQYAFWGNIPEFQVQAVWGYAELALDAGKHYDALMERQEDALAVFQQRREEIASES
jgi:hypothetical protein